MDIPVEKQREYVRRLILSRTRLLVKNGFFGLLLMNVEFGLDITIETAATDGEKIWFSPDFLDELDDRQLDFVLMHEVMHMALSHCFRGKEFDQRLFNIACDVVVNSNIFRAMPELDGLIVAGYPPMRYTPDGKEGADYTAEEVYAMLLDRGAAQGGEGQNAAGQNGGQTGGRNGNGKGESGKKGGARAEGRGRQKGERANGGDFSEEGQFDSHDRWKEVEEEGNERQDLWNKRVADAAQAVLVRDPSDSRGQIPALVKRMLEELKKPQTDWRTLLADFLSEEKTDYSFAPPDRRFDGPFLLPDFNDVDVAPVDILFMIDTSASMSDEMVTAAYSEVKGAVDQFNGRLKGLLGFFDADITEPQPFCDESELRRITPQGGGGTDFRPIFAWARKRLERAPLNGIIVLTDGYAPFPDESAAAGVPVVWIVNNDDVRPPWGKTARIKI